MTDLEDMMVDRDMSDDDARDVLADASDSDEDRYERHRERLSDFAEQEREERRREYAEGFADGERDRNEDIAHNRYQTFHRKPSGYPRSYWVGRERGYRSAVA